MKKHLIVITSREPYNNEGNSHMRYLDVLIKMHEVVFIQPPEKWPTTSYKNEIVNDNLTIFKYRNILPYRFFPKIVAKINDVITSFCLSRFIKDKSFILWQFDPYYLEMTPFLSIEKKLYFPLDSYLRDYRDNIFATRSDLLATVNSTFLKHQYSELTKKSLLVPHGYSEDQRHPDIAATIEIKKRYGKFAILTGSLTSNVDYPLLIELADRIDKFKILLVGKKVVSTPELEVLLKKSNVEYLGSKSYKVLKNYITSSKVCLVAYDKEVGPWRNPIKITDYLALDRPVINTVPLKDLNELNDCGLFTTFNNDDFIKLVIKGLNDELEFNKEKLFQWRNQNNYNRLTELVLQRLLT